MFDNSQIDDSEEEIIDTTQKSRTQSKKIFKSNDELLDLIKIYEIHSESECSETEDVQASMFTALTDIFDIIYEESVENWQFRSLSRRWFGSPDYHSEVREILIDYIPHNSRRFENHLPEELDEYIRKMMEDGEWGGEHEIAAFSKLYSVNIIVYDEMSCSTSYFIAENENATHTVYLLMIHNNHFNTLKVKEQTKSTDFQKVKKKDYKKLESKVEKPEKDQSLTD